MSSNLTRGNNREVETVSTRVKNTKKEIEQLKNELEQLITLGTQKSFPSLVTERRSPEINPPVIRKVEVPRHEPSKKTLPPAPKKTTELSKSPKVRNYNVEEAREYIKKQKEKRAEQVKKQINAVDSKIDIKKQKLKELHQKTLKLVSKNVQIKRERSKSRDQEPIRLDRSPHKPQENIPKFRDKSRDRFLKPQPKAPKSQEQVAKAGRVSRPRVRPKPQSTAPKFLNVPKFTPSAEFEKTVLPPFETTIESVDLNERVIHDANFTISENNEPKAKEKQVLEHSIMTDACVKDTKETQTRENNFEAWTPPTGYSNPYNFINTVKRKIQHEINLPRGVDVGVQNSGDSNRTPVTDFKSKEEIREMLIKSIHSDMKSFASHKCPNLDLKAVEDLELIPNKNESLSKNLFSGYDSESDTSKNIPEISSESLGSSSKPQLSLGRVKDLKLQYSTVKTDTNGHDNSYSSDFQKDSTSSKKSKSDGSTIKTVASEREESIATEKSSNGTRKNTSTNENTPKEARNDSQKSFKSLLTETPSNSSEQLKSVPEFLALKEPNVSLVRKNSDPSKNLMNTVTIRSASTSSGSSQASFKSLLTEDKISKSSTSSVPETSNFAGKNSKSVRDDVDGDGSKSSSIRTSKLSNSVPESLDFVGQKSTGDNASTAKGSSLILENLNQGSRSTGGSVESLGLKEPTISLTFGREEKNDNLVKSQMKNVTLRPAVTTTNNVNEIHLKFEAEVRLLNDFNESFKQFMAVEKEFENLRNKNENNLVKIFQNVDTQTSVVTKTSTNVTDRSPRNSSINYSRGSDIEDLNNSVLNNRNTSSLSTDWNLSNLNDSSFNMSTEKESVSLLSISNIENYNVKNCPGIVSLNIFDQLIKDEDTRIQQLKAIIKIREQALLDRTKGELVWLEIQKKQLIETGKIEEASLLKKKQRGIILKHEQERNEIKKLKQMQKEVSEHRKNTLKQQRNLIKTQLSTDHMLSTITVKKRRERRSMGPLRVVQSCSESIQSEASISLKSSGIDDVLSVTSKSVRVSEESEGEVSRGPREEMAPVLDAKRTLLMREAALQKRRETAEELLRWHRKLLDEERKISELEAAATSIVREGHKDKKHRFNGRQLNQLWRGMTGSDEKKFVEDKLYVMSQMALERLCKNARQHSSKNKKAPAKSATHTSDNSRKSSDEVNYSSGFEPESVHDIINSQEEKTKISSISELIDNFSRIEDEISTLSKKSEDIVSLKDRSSHSEMTPSQIEEVKEESESEKTVPEESIEESEEKEPITEISIQKNESIQKTISEESDEKNLEESYSIEDEPVSKSIQELSTVQTDQLESRIEEAQSSDIASSVKPVEELSVPQIDTQEISENISTRTEESSPIVEEEKSPVDTKETVSSIEDKDVTVESLGLEEALESAFKIEESLTKINEQLATKEESSVETEISKENEISNEVETSSKIDEIASGKEETSSKVEEIASAKEETSSKIEEIASGKEQTSSKIEEIVSGKDTSSKIEEIASGKEETSSKVEEIAFGKETSSKIEEVASEKEETSSKIEEIVSEKESSSKIEETASSNEQTSSKIEEISPGRETSEETSKKDEISPRKEETSPKSDSTSASSESSEKTPQKSNHIDVKKRVSEILADASPSRGDKSPRLQDLYVTAYDVGPNSTDFPESFGGGRQLPTDIFGNEAEELWRKQLAIEQEIKQIELQQKEQLPYVYMREIPNKPPPPYTPPSSLSTIIPSDVKDINEVASYSSKVLYKAYQNKNLHKVKFSENGFKLFSKVGVPKSCAEYLFNICKDLAKDHYKQFETVEEPPWLELPKKPQFARTKLLDAVGLEKMLMQKLKELFGFKKAQVTESAIIKWGRKKRDHVDEVLVLESQEEECQWTNFDKDELIVKNQVMEDIMKTLLDDTANVFAKILAKKRGVIA